MKKGLFILSTVLFLIYFSVGASNYSWISDSLFGSSMRSKKDKKEKSQMRPKKKKKKSHMRLKKPSTVTMRWNFKKGKVNPTVKFYDMSNRGRQIHGSVKLQNNTSVSVRCLKGHRVCFGGNFKLIGQHYTIGCGKNCKLYNRMSSSEKRYSCEICRQSSVRKATKIRKR